MWVSENSCSKNFGNFQERHPGEIAFLKKVAGYVILTGNVLLGNFQDSFHKKHPRMPASGISCHWKMFRPKYIFQKIAHSIFLIYVLIFYGMCSQGLKEKSGFKIIFLKLVLFSFVFTYKTFLRKQFFILAFSYFAIAY